jgi:F0F1-type ATP synthase assembly protein I
MTSSAAVEARLFKQYLVRGYIGQALLLCVLSVVAAFGSATLGRSILLGGAIAMAPIFIFSMLSLRHMGSAQSASFLVSLVTGFLGKLLLIGFGLWFVLTRQDNIEAMPLLMALIGFYLLGVVMTGILSSKAAAAAQEAITDHGL